MIPLSTLLQSGRDDSNGDVLRFESVVVGLDGFSEGCADSHFSKKVLADVTFERSKFSISLRESTFRAVHFLDCFFDRVWMTRSRWHNCRFDSSTMTPEMTDAVFVGCSFSGVRIKGVGQEYGGRRTHFLGCDLRGAKVTGLKLLAARFVDCQMDGCEFTRCDLRGTIVNGEKK